MSTIASSRKPVISRDDELSPIDPESGLAVFVVFTSIDWTLKALEKAREIARPVGAKIVVVAAQIVPYPLPLDEPPVPMEFVIRRFEEKVGEFPEKTQISAYLCRDLMEAFNRILNRNCPIVIGTQERWWPTHNERLARKLHRAGYDVITVKTE
jgi:hypothetical protein